MIDGKSFFCCASKNKDETHGKITEMRKSNDYTTGNLLDYDYFLNHYRLIAIDLSKQIELDNPDSQQQINFKMMKQQWFSSLKNQKKRFLNFHKIL